MTLIYLADLTHTTITVSSDSFPLGAGMVAAYATARFPDLRVELFKYPEKLKEAIDRHVPDVLAVSNYPWNLSLGSSFLSYAKRLRPETITVMGGPNMSYEPGEQERFLRRYADCIDFYTLYEGETAFASLLEAAFAVEFDLARLHEIGPAGTITLHEGKLNPYKAIPRQRELDQFRSPYQTGLFDRFFDDVLSPMIETHRGCPYSCSFCHEGHVSYTKVNRFPLETVLADLDYIGERVGSKVKNLLIADPNFGMFPRDLEIARHIAALRERSGFPTTIFATTAKNAGPRLVEISEIFGDRVSMPIWMSVQSMNPDVLDNIKRRNIKVSHMITVQEALAALGSNSKSELILCLPGETLKTHVQSLVRLIEIGIDQVVSYQLMLVNGSEMRVDADVRADPELRTRFRVLPRSFTSMEGVPVSIETEEIVVATNDLSFADYLEARQLHLLVSIFYNGKAFKGFFRLLAEAKIELEPFLYRLLDEFRSAPGLRTLNDDFLSETVGELFESEDALRAHFSDPERFERLCAGSIGGNLVQRFTSAAYVKFGDTLTRAIAAAIEAVGPDSAPFRAQVRDLANHYRLSFEGIADPARVSSFSEETFAYDVHGWLHGQGSLEMYRYATPRKVTYHTPPEQFAQVESYFERYGRDAQALGKILTRLWIVDMFRQPVKRD